MNRILMPAILLVLIMLAFSSTGLAQTSRAIDFAQDIAPVFRDRCLSCHAETANGGLRLTSRNEWTQGGESGPVAVPGDAANSLIWQLVTAKADADHKMPPEGSRLNSDQLKNLRHWLNEGAVWPDDVVLKSPKAAAAEHWAFQPVQRPVVPLVSETSAGRNEIDAFVADELRKRQITPSREADQRTLLRRATLDLTGLPPTPEQMDAFLNDADERAYEHAVDRLLASSAYGERWARPWLDLSHFADTDGYLTDQKRPVAWRYRQWLIDALNRDLPFDQFTIEQLAGDLLPEATSEQLLATGFLRNTLSNREGGADLEEYRVEQIVDRTRMVGTAWLGLTVGCARCHDHKYDPLSQKEFFELYAILNQADEVNLNLPLPGELPAFDEKYPEYRRQRDAVLTPIQAQLDELQLRWESRMLEAVAKPGADPTWDRQWEVLGLIWGGELGEGQLEGCVIVQTPWEQRTVDEKDRLLDYFLARGSLIDESRFAELKLTAVATSLEELKKTVPWPTRAPTIRQERHSRAVHLHTRGDFRVPAEAVQARVPAWLAAQIDTPHADSRPQNSDPCDSLQTTAVLSLTPPASTRLDLARWLVSRDNPLTSRVVVNRMWQEFFGRGLVDPPDDFGLRGLKPSHPELLDWLAFEFMECDWSVKRMHRLIVTSATYRQSSAARPELITADPNNHWLARQQPLRFSSDQVRDAALSVSGLLENRVGGPSVFPPQPDVVAKEGFSNVWKTSDGADRYRRGLYTWIQRLSPFAQYVTFDAPPTNTSCTRRDRSNSPLQALTLLNDGVFFEAAQAMSRSVLVEPAADDNDRLNRIVLRALSRPASPEELHILADCLREQRLLLVAAPEKATLIAPEPVKAIPAAEVAAWTSVCSVVLNLHEFITRE